jgi:hypothetical protein
LYVFGYNDRSGGNLIREVTKNNTPLVFLSVFCVAIMKEYFNSFIITP